MSSMYMCACVIVCVCAQDITVENMESLVGQEIPVQFLQVNEVRPHTHRHTHTRAHGRT